MAADDDEIGLPFPGPLDDQIADAGAEGLAEKRRHGDAARGDTDLASSRIFAPNGATCSCGRSDSSRSFTPPSTSAPGLRPRLERDLHADGHVDSSRRALEGLSDPDTVEAEYAIVVRSER